MDLQGLDSPKWYDCLEASRSKVLYNTIIGCLLNSKALERAVFGLVHVQATSTLGPYQGHMSYCQSLWYAQVSWSLYEDFN